MTIETKAEFARRQGVNKSTITRLAQAGRLVLDDAGRVEVEASLERIEATRGYRDDVADRHAAARAAEPAPKAAEPEPPQDIATEPALSLTEIGLRTRHAQMLEREASARMKAREEQEQAGELVRRAAVIKDMTDAVAILSNTAEALPDRATPLLLGCNDAARIRAVLRDEVQQFLLAASEQLGAIAGQGHARGVEPA